MLSNVFTQLENGPSQTHLAATGEHTGPDIHSVTHTCSLAHTHLPSHASGSPQNTGMVTCPHPSVHMQTPDLRTGPLKQILPAHKVTPAMQGQNFTASRGWSKAPQLITGSCSCSEHKVVPAPEDTHAAPLHTLFESDELLREVNSSYLNLNSSFKQLCTDHLGQGRLFTHTCLQVHSCQHVLFSPTALSPLNTGGKKNNWV